MLQLCLPVSQFVVDCNSVQSLPTITFIVSGTQFPLPPSTYVFNVHSHCQAPWVCDWMGQQLSCVPAHIWAAMGHPQGQG